MNNDSIPSTSSGTNETRTAVETPVAAITTFHDDTVGEISTPVAQFSSTTFLEGTAFSGAENIITFLERPTLITSGAFSVTDSGNLWTGDVFKTLVTGTKAPKLAGVYGIKADLRLVLQVNAVRFQTGRYILAFIPSGGLPVTDVGYLASAKTHATTLTNITQLPHVEIDIATQTHVELVVPWDCVYPYFVNLSTYPVGIGNFILRPYVALSAASGDTTCGYTLFAAFKNISLIGATVTQASFGEKEQRKAGIGPVESALTKIGKASSILGEIPILGPGASTVSWTASILARAAHVFGWSKPADISVAKTVVSRPFRFLNNVDGEAVSEVLGGMSTNRVVSHPRLGGTKADEMSFDYVKSVYAYHTSFSWSASSPAATILLSLNTGPNNFQTALGNGTIMTPVCFMVQNFQYWRGALKFRIKLVKNEFYSGRLVVWFQPNYHATSIHTTLDQNEFLERVILDIRECCEAEFIVPYIAPEMYTGSTLSTGTFGVTVLDSLVAPSTVPSTITVLVEVAGGDDFQVSFVRPSPYEVWIPAVTQSAFEVEVQSAYEICPTETLGRARGKDIVNSAQVAAGEKFESFRQLTRLFTLDSIIAQNPLWFFVNTNIGYIRPFLHQVVTQATSNTTAVTRGVIYSTMLDVIASCYSMETGSMRQVIQPADGGKIMLVGLGASGTTNALYKSQAGPLGTAANNIRYLNWSEQGSPGDYIVPSYQITIGRPVAANFVTSGSPSLFPATGNPTTVIFQNSAVSAANGYYVAGRAGGDDYNCYGFVSVPALILRSQA